DDWIARERIVSRGKRLERLEELPDTHASWVPSGNASTASRRPRTPSSPPRATRGSLLTARPGTPANPISAAAPTKDPLPRYDAGMLTRFAALAVVASLTLLSMAEADELDRAIEAEMARQQVPGLTLAIVRKGEIVRPKAYGYGDLEWRSKATPDTRFEIASMSKMVTGAAARIPMDEGKLDPEGPVNR